MYNLKEHVIKWGTGGSRGIGFLRRNFQNGVELPKVAKGVEVSVLSISGNSGVIGNKMADDPARLGSA